MKVSEIMKEAKGTLIDKWKKVISITVIYMAITFCISFIIGIFDEGSIIENILVVVELLITIPLSFGIEWAFLRLKRNETVKTIDFLKTSISKFFRAWKITVRILLKMIFSMSVIIIGAVLYTIIVNYSIMQAQEGNTMVAQLGLGVALGIYFAPIILAMFKLLKYSLTSFIAYDKPNARTSEVVNESEKLMKKNRWKIILLQLPHIVWVALGSFLFAVETSYIEMIVYIIGYMILFPYTQIAMVCFYERLAQPKNNEEA